MPFCRKCGRRLAEYSEVCTDCGQSTTSPIINTKRTGSVHLSHSGMDKKIAKAIIPEVAPVKIKVIIDKPAKTAAPAKAVSVVKAVAPQRVVFSVKVLAPVKAAPAKAVEPPPKPVLSAKHIVKPKKAKQTKPTAPFTLTNARPVAGLNPQPELVTPPKPRPHLKQPAQTTQVVQPKPVTQIAIAQPVQPKPSAQIAPPAAPAAPVAVLQPAVQPAFSVQLAPIAQPEPVIKPVARVRHAASAKALSPPKPVEPAPVYPPHEIIKSNVSLKEDLLAHPEDYETEAFEFDLKCPNGHFFREGKMLPVSKGRAYCPQCGERLSKPKPKKRRYRRRTYFH